MIREGPKCLMREPGDLPVLVNFISGVKETETVEIQRYLFLSFFSRSLLTRGNGFLVILPKGKKLPKC